jgi:hypothetical protein
MHVIYTSGRWELRAAEPADGYGRRPQSLVGAVSLGQEARDFLSCGERTARQALDQRLRAAKADWDAIAGTMNPDGDADLADKLVTGFRVVDCLGCGGGLKTRRHLLRRERAA